MSASAASSTVFLPLPPARDIPVTFSASFRSWWASGTKEGAAAEERLLRRLPFFYPEKMTPSRGDSPVIAHREQINLGTPRHYLNTLSIKSTSPAPNAPPPAVMLHGYGAGLGFFFRNFPALAKWAGHRGTDVYAVDWLGMGRSARVPFAIRAKRDDIPGRVKEAESFFVDSLEEWRAKMGLDQMTLIGHSLGAYFSLAYALRYPTRVNKLILLSPAGVARDPNLTMPSRELTDTGDSSSSKSDSLTPASKGEVKKVRDEQRRERQQESRMRKVFTYLWEEGWSPFQVVRSSLFWGPLLIGKYSARRFGGLTLDETKDMHDYILNITLSKGSGEYCISHVLAPGAHARMPMVDRVAELKIPITFAYGDQDWMDPKGGSQSVKHLRHAGNEQGRMYIVPNAGHHLYLDNPKAVNELLIKELDRQPKQSRSSTASSSSQ
ncbi:alpha beta-hydrolase [Coniophora puteana RWD-64-598 SS2]|uniref:Alpha beta-hydrolase n=1 Tax=Coniophora puteana (strain RWD-64-598) TaxID=741705 RepID=A0A5M3MU11_CONPW|nr:alpha beta-hydrolase [Coniophora puteana RWD-64-598 SS2]EIW82537.1 alpha beta-hydrolase [Coniophora puteana RWD-64-598 SS2]